MVCPAVGVPVGTGVINPGGNYNIWRDNWVYGNTYAGLRDLRGCPGSCATTTGFAEQFDTSHHNRYVSNGSVVTPDRRGRAERHGLLVGRAGRRVAAGSAPRRRLRTARAAAPAARRPGRHRWLLASRRGPEDVRLQRLLPAEARLPGSCDWFGARGLERIEVQLGARRGARARAVVLVLWARFARRGRGGTAAAIVTLAGLAVGVFGTAYEGTLVAPIGLALLGLGWLGFGLALRQGGRPGLGWLTVALGVLALPARSTGASSCCPGCRSPPVWARILLELVWVPWALVAILRRGRNRAPAAAVG